jgi:hypothetical protein
MVSCSNHDFTGAMFKTQEKTQPGSFLGTQKTTSITSAMSFFPAQHVLGQV